MVSLIGILSVVVRGVTKVSHHDTPAAAAALALLAVAQTPGWCRTHIKRRQLSKRAVRVIPGNGLLLRALRTINVESTGIYAQL